MKHATIGKWSDISHSEHARIRRQKVKKEVLTHYGNGNCSCVRCGFEDIRALSIDHINGNGHYLRTKNKSHRNITKWLKDNDFPIGYQTLCMNCQFIKRFEKGEENPTVREKLRRSEGVC